MSCVFGRKIGRGGSADVFLGTYKGREVALKLFRDSYRDRDRRMQREIEVLRSLQHKHVIRFLDALEVDCDDQRRLVIVMEYAAGGTLHDYISTKGHSYTDADADSIIYQIASGVAYLRSKHILHRDIKPKNILFIDGDHKTAVIADFGLANDCSQASYMAAQLYQPLNDAPFNFKSDVFSLGRVACCVIARQNLDGQNLEQTIDKALSERSGARLSVLERSLSHRNDKRPSAEEFEQAFGSSPSSPVEQMLKGAFMGAAAGGVIEVVKGAVDKAEGESKQRKRGSSQEQVSSSDFSWGPVLLGAAIGGIGGLILSACKEADNKKTKPKN